MAKKQQDVNEKNELGMILYYMRITNGMENIYIFHNKYMYRYMYMHMHI